MMNIPINAMHAARKVNSFVATIVRMLYIIDVAIRQSKVQLSTKIEHSIAKNARNKIKERLKKRIIATLAFGRFSQGY